MLATIKMPNKDIHKSNTTISEIVDVLKVIDNLNGVTVRFEDVEVKAEYIFKAYTKFRTNWNDDLPVKKNIQIYFALSILSGNARKKQQLVAA